MMKPFEIQEKVIMLKSHARWMVLILCCLFFFSLGVTVAAFGPLLPELSALNGVDLSRMGQIFTFYFLGSLIAQILSGPLSDRFGEKPLMLAATLLLMGSVATLPFSHTFPLSLLLFSLTGLGGGAIVLTTNVLIARVYADRSVSALNLLNLFFGVGAFLSPALVGLIAGQTGNGRQILWLVSGLLIVQGILFVWLRIPPAIRTPHSAAGTGMRFLLRNRLIWLLALLLLLYVGVENGFGGWITVYMQRTLNLPYEQAALSASAFWLALTAGRLVTVVLGMRLSAVRILALSLGGALTGSLLMVVGRGNLPLSAAGILLTGFSFASIFPSTVSLSSASFPEQAGRAMGIINGMASIGAMVLPWLQGVLLNTVSPLASTLLTLGGVVGMALLLAAARPLTQAVAPSSIPEAAAGFSDALPR
ncbi:MAG: MFS transporter [Chloroflexota bacterium]